MKTASCIFAKWLLLSTIDSAFLYENGGSASVGRIYEFAQELYAQGNVYPALKSFETAFRNHLYREDVELNCQFKCQDLQTFEHDDEDLEANAFGSLFQKTLCLETCYNDSNASEMSRASGESKRDLENRFVYHYLHFLYNELGEGAEAMNLVWTYLQKFPKNSDMLSNYFLYLEMYPELNRANTTFIDYDESTLHKTVKKIVELYKAEDYTKLPPLINAAVDEYFQEQTRCQRKCYLVPPSVFGQIISHVLYEQEVAVLDCKRNCLKIKSPYGVFSDLLVKFFLQNLSEFNPLVPLDTFLHYLHFVYFQIGEHAAAAQTGMTRLLLPEMHGESHESISADLEAFKKLNPDTIIRPRPDITAHLNELDQLESYLLQIVPASHLPSSY